MSYLLTEKLSSTLAVYMIIKRVMRPWNKWEAYKYGIIDDKGKRLRRPKTYKERNAWDILDRFCWGIKRVCTKYMNDSQFVYLFSLAYLMKEKAEIIINKHYLTELDDMTYEKQLKIYDCMSELKQNNIVLESNLDIETNIFKNLDKVKLITDKYLIEDEIAGTSLGDIAQFTPVINYNNKIKRRQLIRRRKKNGNNNT